MLAETIDDAIRNLVIVCGKIAYTLDTCQRQGTKNDVPEGGRYITISDTKALEMSRVLNRYVAELEAFSVTHRGAL